MKAPRMSSGDGKAKKERSQGHVKGSGVNKPVTKAKVKQEVAKVRFGNISQTQKS